MKNKKKNDDLNYLLCIANTYSIKNLIYNDSLALIAFNQLIDQLFFVVVFVLLIF